MFLVAASSYLYIYIYIYSFVFFRCRDSVRPICALGRWLVKPNVTTPCRSFMFLHGITSSQMHGFEPRHQNVPGYRASGVWDKREGSDLDVHVSRAFLGGGGVSNYGR